MPRKRKTPTDGDTQTGTTQQGIYWLPNDARWGGFINIRLGDGDREEFASWDAENPNVGWQVLEDVMGEGAKVGFAYDRKNQCVILTFTGALVANSNERYCVTSRAGTIREAIQLAGWKHFILAHGDYGAFSPKTGKLNNWG